MLCLLLSLTILFTGELKSVEMSLLVSSLGIVWIIFWLFTCVLLSMIELLLSSIGLTLTKLKTLSLLSGPKGIINLINKINQR